MLKKIIFIVGPHGVGKTYVTTQIRKELKALHLDLGPIIRRVHQEEEPQKTLLDWLHQGEEIYGSNFSDIVLCREINDAIRNHSEQVMLITGSRSIPGVEYILNTFSIKNYALIYLDAPKSLLKSNYEKRENIRLSHKEFEGILEAENKMGLKDLKRYISQNSLNSFYIINKDNSPLLLKKVKSIISKMAPHSIKMAKFDFGLLLQRSKGHER